MTDNNFDQSHKQAKSKGKRNPLGRGLDAIFSSSEESPQEQGSLRTIQIGEIYPNADQPRRKFGEQELTALSQSIADQGVLQPIILTQGSDGKYQIVAGERRWRAAQMAGLHTIPAIVRAFDQQQSLEIALIENLQRSDLSPFEEAKAMQQMLDQHNHTQETIARVLGKSRPYIANALRLLSLEDRLIQRLEELKLSAGHARCLIGLTDEQADQLISKITANSLSVRQTEQMAKKIKQPRKSSATTATAADEPFPTSDAQTDGEAGIADSEKQNIKDVENSLSQAIGFTVKLTITAAGDGNIKLYFDNSTQLNDLILQILRKKDIS